ncbi:uncharacterized protein BCR38DRAFT_409952 [Pseudomassariella vexata]|uniref:Uncharacterized protein n=1 Tax=Pseudomassariella vexata TaxID=1141098 RepID=A0A1Y2DUL8_9PEZI|nr:uncharacterized protein BCR38DRAFT_409952 [Pseudomassariella vexata]ORY62972.1 hypothetical protein BCR38DRAFT_409952 [Pseudomassariella vexata]
MHPGNGLVAMTLVRQLSGTRTSFSGWLARPAVGPKRESSKGTTNQPRATLVRRAPTHLFGPYERKRWASVYAPEIDSCGSVASPLIPGLQATSRGHTTRIKMRVF